MKTCTYCRCEYAPWTGDWRSIVACKPCVTRIKAEHDALTLTNAEANAAERERIDAIPERIQPTRTMRRADTELWQDRQARGWDNED